MASERDPRNGYGNYTDDHIERLRYIRKLQNFGFSLKEIESAIKLNDNAEMTDAIRVSILRQKLDEVEQKLISLSEYKESLQLALNNLKNRAN